MTRKSDLAVAVLAALGAVVFLVWLWMTDSRSRHPLERLGRAVAWQSTCPFPQDSQARVVATGLGEVRGLACNGQGGVFLADSKGHVMLWSANGLLEPSYASAEPDSTDLRGLAMADGALLLAEHGRGSLLRWDGQSMSALSFGIGPYSGPAGIARAGDTLFLTDDRPWPGAPEEQAYDSADYGRWLEKGTPRLFGAVYACTPQDHRCERVGTRLRHPSGIAAMSATGPVFVAEADSTEVRWAILKKDESGSWKQSGALGSAATGGKPMPPFLGVALDPANGYVFAAGPLGIYVFSTEGSILGRVDFDDPVSGLSCQPGAVFAVVGHRLCRIGYAPREAGSQPAVKAGK